MQTDKARVIGGNIPIYTFSFDIIGSLGIYKSINGTIEVLCSPKVQIISPLKIT